MKMPKTKIIKIYFGWLISCFLLFSLASSSVSTQRQVLLLKLDGAVSPATQNFIERGIALAEKQPIEAVILQIDTPGGLDKSMHGVVSRILASSVPVISYVAPSGARAASAGTFIVYASHVAAMAAGTNLGAAKPVSMNPSSSTPEKASVKEDSTIANKAKNDAMASIRSLAQLRGRNVQWAEQAVSQGASLSATEALNLHVIDVIANDIPDLLNKTDQRRVLVKGQPKILQTAGLSVTEFQPDWRTRFLTIITDPNIAYILLMIGMWGLFFEFVNPGFVLPGVVGGICLLLALYAFQLLPINYAGLGLILLGITCMIAELFITNYGVLGVGGVVSFLVGSIMLMHTGVPGFKLSLSIILLVTILSALFFLIIIGFVIKARKRPIVSGREQLIGGKGVVIMDERGRAWIRIEGELWEVKARKPLTAGQQIRVIKIENLTLIVEPIE